MTVAALETGADVETLKRAILEIIERFPIWLQMRYKRIDTQKMKKNVSLNDIFEVAFDVSRARGKGYGQLQKRLSSTHTNIKQRAPRRSSSG